MLSFNINARPIDILEATTFIFSFAGLEGINLAKALDNVFKAITGFHALNAGNIKLPEITHETALTPAEIAKAVGLSGSKKSAKLINSMLEEAGYQSWLKGKNNWTPTEKGREFAVLLDTSKKYTDSSPILQLKWKPATVSIVQDLLPF